MRNHDRPSRLRHSRICQHIRGRIGQWSVVVVGVVTSATADSSLGSQADRIAVVVSRQEVDSLDWLPMLAGLKTTLWTEHASLAASATYPQGRNHSRWRAKPRTWRGGTTRECGGYLAFVADNYEALPEVTAFVHGGQAPHHTYPHPHSDPNILFTVRELAQSWSEPGYCSLNVYYTDWSIAAWLPDGWRRELVALRESRSYADSPGGLEPDSELLSRLPALLAPLLSEGAGASEAGAAPSVVRCFCCGQFAVGRGTLQRLPRSFWQELLHFVQGDPGLNPWDYGADGKPLPDRVSRRKNGRCALMEASWHFLFGQTAACDRQQCSCRARFGPDPQAAFILDRSG